MQSLITLFMCGDVMTGRGIDQVLPHPSSPRLHEPYVKSALEYVALAEEVNGPILRPVDFPYIWGHALSELKRVAPDARIINLETSITTSEDYCIDKGIHYRMNPKNIPCLQAARIDVCSLANNHTLDWGYSGLFETLETLKKAGIGSTGAGWRLKEAEAPAIVEVRGKGRVVVFSIGSETSGIPVGWAATADRPGVNVLKDFSDQTVRAIAAQVDGARRQGDIVVISIHWGANWGFDVPSSQAEFVHRLVDEAGVDVVHGHSSHHVKAIEVYRERLILYGCGDFISDYEGIGGHEYFRGDLGLMYFATLDASTGRLAGLRMTPTQVKRFQVNRANPEDSRRLNDTLNREGKRFQTRAKLTEEGLELLWR